LSDVQKCAYLDERVAHQLQQIELAPTMFSSLPALGVPGWWPDQVAEFYDDEFVFRAARQVKM